jgi:hypothetical protein
MTHPHIRLVFTLVQTFHWNSPLRASPLRAQHPPGDTHMMSDRRHTLAHTNPMHPHTRLVFTPVQPFHWQSPDCENSGARYRPTLLETLAMANTPHQYVVCASVTHGCITVRPNSTHMQGPTHTLTLKKHWQTHHTSTLCVCICHPWLHHREAR